jgi:hypothetical protein
VHPITPAGWGKVRGMTKKIAVGMLFVALLLVAAYPVIAQGNVSQEVPKPQERRPGEIRPEDYKPMWDPVLGRCLGHYDVLWPDKPFCYDEYGNIKEDPEPWCQAGDFYGPCSQRPLPTLPEQ